MMYGFVLRISMALKILSATIRRIAVRIFLDIFSDRDQVIALGEPDGVHRGAFFSPAFPQDFSQVATFSWLTDCPASSSPTAAWISPSCHSSCSTYAAMASAARKDFGTPRMSG